MIAVLEDDDVVIQQQLLLARHIDKHIRIALIQIIMVTPSILRNACSRALLAWER